ncbi:UNVERIFIED_CONTAM: type 1 fimbrial protein [Comamonas sp. A-3]
MQCIVFIAYCMSCTLLCAVSISILLMCACERSTRVTGMPAATSQKDFSLNLTCAGGDTGTSTRMFVVFSDAQNPENRSTTLSLSKDSVAKNVGIEIQRENERLVNFGPESGEVNQWMVGEFANEPVNIKLKARYISTSLVQEPTPGSANADATFVISYK